MQETRGALETRRFRICHTLCVFGCDTPWRGSLARSNTSTIVGHYAEGSGKLYVAGGLAG